MLTEKDIQQLRELADEYLTADLEKVAGQMNDAQKAVAKAVTHDAAYAYDVGFLKRAEEVGLDKKEAMAAYDLARQRFSQEG